MRGLYVHIPFCKSICNYCDFPKMVSCRATYEKYMDALLKELDGKKNLLTHVDTVYIGGGTPNVLPNDLLERLLTSLGPYLKTSVESTIECNPELVTEEQVLLFRKYGISRVSLGVQTIDETSLKILGRHHRKENVEEAIRLLRTAGISNISCDFIFGIPGTTLKTLGRDLEFVKEMGIPHVSFYSLILEEKTVFSYQERKGLLEFPDDDLVADMYDMVNQKLKEYGFHHYEISNYAKPGFESKHNMLYWRCEEYVGIGMGAAEYVKPFRNANYRTMREYLELGKEETEEITHEEEKKEFMMLGLRMTEGISVSEYRHRFNSTPEADFRLDRFFQQGLLKKDSDRIWIPEDKLFIANLVYEEFVD